MTPVVKNRLLGVLIALAIFVTDQLLKGYVLHGLKMRLSDSISFLPIFNFTLTHNYGVSLGMFTADSQEMRWILVGVTAAIAIGVTVWMLRESKLADIAGLAMILGGALGNIKDRYDYGYVIDFLDLHFGAFRPFLIFNIADAAITIGVVIILARSLFASDKGETEPASEAVES